MNASMACPTPSAEAVRAFVILEVGVGAVLAAVGAVGNLLTAASLASPGLGGGSRGSTFYRALTFLALFDAAYLTLHLTKVWMQENRPLTDSAAVVLFWEMVYPFEGVFNVASVYMTAVLAVARALVVKRPMSALSVTAGANRRANWKKVFFKWALPVFLVSVALNSPKFFESNFETLLNGGLKRTDSPLTRTSAYALGYKLIVKTFFTCIAPLMVMSVCNVIIAKVLWQQRTAARALISSNPASIEELRVKRAVQQSAILAAVVTIFILAYAPRAALNILDYTERDRIAQCGRGRWPSAAVLAVGVSNVLVVFNSAVNPLIYATMSSQFREAAADRVAGVWAGALTSAAVMMATVSVGASNSCLGVSRNEEDDGNERPLGHHR